MLPDGNLINFTVDFAKNLLYSCFHEFSLKKTNKNYGKYNIY